MEEVKQKNIKGIRIQTANIVMIIASCILYVLLISATVHVSREYDNMHNSMERYIECEESDALLTAGSAHLTEQARLYAVTMDPKYMAEYFKEVNETRRREQALEGLRRSHDGEEAYAFLVAALENSNALMEREVYAMRLVAEAEGETNIPPEVRSVEVEQADLLLSREEMMEKARELVFGGEYQASQSSILANVERSMESIHQSTHQRMLDDTAALEESMVRQRIFVSVLFVGQIVTFLMIILLIVKPLRIYVRCIKEDKMMEITGSYEFKYLALTYNDIYEINAANETMLRYRAEHDPLTGIANRSAFDQLKTLLAAKAGPIALLIIDVDKFKQVNDGYGHEMGDRVLKRVAKLIEESFRNTDYPARIGGDEFAVILTDITEEQKGMIAEKVAHMNDLLTHPGDDIPKVSLSVGGAFSSKGFAGDLYQKADSALYDVKEHGRCGCSFFEET